MKKYKIGISCIGSGVGQSVINSLRLSSLPITTFGFGNNPYAFGAYDCDQYDYLPSIYSENYIEDLIKACLHHEIDLLIPGIDDEAHLMAQNKKRFDKVGIKIICSGPDLNEICRDKQRLSTVFNHKEDLFVSSFTKESIINEIEDKNVSFPLIAKPKGGFASRNIQIINELGDLDNLSEDHIIQEIAFPRRNDKNYDQYIDAINRGTNPQLSEISIQLVYNPEGNLMGRMASQNKLYKGMPIEILPIESEEIWEAIDLITPKLLDLGLRGPLNIQGRLTDKGLKLFEMNPRFTGITGLRALMGFNEVEACVKEWLGIDKGKNKLQINYKKFGMKQYTDKSVLIDRNLKVKNDYQNINLMNNKVKKNILITGASGYIGQAIINTLAESHQDSFDVWVLGRDKKILDSLFEDRVEKVLSTDDLDNGRLALGNVDILLHLGFARPHRTDRQIADSLRFTTELFTRANSHQIPAIINISSQSVYGINQDIPWSENTAVSPAWVYSQAKYASELLLSSLNKINNQLMFSSVRLGSVAGGSNGLIEVDVLSKLVRQAYSGETINIVDGTQQISRIDIRDVVPALIKMLHSDPGEWKPVYNLGNHETNSLIEIAKIVVDLAEEHNGGVRSDIVVAEANIEYFQQMDSSLFMKEMVWEPTHKISDTIESLLEYIKKSV